MPIVIVGILVFIIIALLIYNVNIHNKIQKFNSLNQKVTNLNVLQDFMNTIGELSSVEEKLKRINEILIEKYDIKYSTIVVFDGTDYQIKDSNVDEKHWNALRTLQDVDIFKDSIATATPKYVTVNNDRERLPYQQMEFGRAKSAIFFPLYIDNVYIGYWIIESGVPHDFDNADTTIFEVVKENIITVLKTVTYQRTVESLVRKDSFSGLNTYEYLYGEGKKEIDQYTISTACMFKITNLEYVNKKYSREIGNKMITKVAGYIKQNISSEYLFVRYMGPKFVIMFCGVQPDDVAQFLNDIKTSVEKLIIKQTEQEVSNGEEPKKKKGKTKKEEDVVKPRLNFVMSRYYKGTGLEELLKKLEEYIDNADIEESDINNI